MDNLIRLNKRCFRGLTDECKDYAKATEVPN